MNSENRIGVLDGLRALAILLVLGRHSVRAFWPDLTQPFAPMGGIDFGGLLINGWIGVDLFFVLSGYLITKHLLERFEGGPFNKTGLRDYFKRRFFRIAPAYYVVLTAAILGLFPFFPYPETRDDISWRYLYHLLFMQDYWPSDIIVLFWTLALEIKFYLIVPFLVWATRSASSLSLRLSIPLIVFLTQPLIRWLSVEYALPPFSEYEFYFEHIRSVFHLCLDGFAMGMICAILIHDKVSRRIIEEPLISNLLFYGGAGIFLMISLSGPLVDLHVSSFDKIALNSLIALGFGGMLLGLMGGCFGHRAFQGRILTFIALISYSLYLLHLPALYVAAHIMGFFVDAEGLSGQMHFIAYLPFFLGVSVAASVVLYRLIEKPFIDWSRRASQQEK